MDFLDSLDLQTNDKRSNRMRSWYLYEQYKSLERHQLHAAEQLKNRSYQERLLHRELVERRARRRLYEQRGGSRSEPRAELALPSHDRRAPLSTTTDDFYESFCELNDDFGAVGESVEEGSQDSDMDKAYIEDFKGLGGLEDDTSYAGSVTSVVAKTNDYDVYSNRSATQSHTDIAENINLQLATVKENMLSLEKYARLSDAGRDSEDLSVKSSTPSPGARRNKMSSVYDRNMVTMWSRLVSFAYQVIQLNHGSSYYDYSSQLMTAVLACDVLRRGVNRMCDILQPYVSPIKYADSADGDADSHKNVKRKKCPSTKNTRKSSRFKSNQSVYNMIVARLSDNYHSEQLWRHCSRHSMDKNRRLARAGERARGRRSADSSGRFWPAPRCRCCCHNKVLNPMLKLVRHLDKILMCDVDGFVRVHR